MECSKRDYLVCDVPVHDLVRNCEVVTLVWFDPSLKESINNISELDNIRALNDYVLFYTKESMYLDWLMSKEKVNEYVIAIIHDFETLDKTHQCNQVCAILIVTPSSDVNQMVMVDRHYPKVVGIFKDQNSMLVKLQEVIVAVEHQVDLNVKDVFGIVNKKDNAFRDLQNQLTSFIWWVAFKSTIKVMPHTFDARKEMLDKCRSYYSGNQSELAVIDEFERNYNAENAFRWYTKPCFLFRLLNKALRTEDIEVLYTFRYFIMDLSASLKVARDENTIKRVYRGGIMSRDEVEHYSIGTVVANSGFLSTSRNISVAKQFIGVDPTTGKSPCQSREDETQFVLFEIDIDQDLSPDIVLADISGQSFFPDEEEVLFDLGSTFEIIEIDYDCEHYFWLLRMRPSMNGLQLCQAYEAYIRQEITELTPTLLFGTLLTDMGAYEQSAVYFEQLLARIPYDHDDRSKVYCSVARAYRFTDQFEKALGLLQCAEKLQRAKLPESRFDLARTLAGIATVYYELHDYQQELPYYQESMTFFQEIFPENHIEIARSLNRLGFAYANQQQYNTALKYLFKALIVFKNTALSEHPGPAQVLFNLGVIHHVLGHTEISIDFYHKALKMRETALPCNHPHIAQSYYQISVFYKEQHQYDLSLEYAQRALSIYKKKLVPGHKLIHDVQNIIESLPGDSAIR